MAGLWLSVGDFIPLFFFLLLSSKQTKNTFVSLSPCQPVQGTLLLFITYTVSNAISRHKNYYWNHKQSGLNVVPWHDISQIHCLCFESQFGWCDTRLCPVFDICNRHYGRCWCAIPFIPVKCARSLVRSLAHSPMPATDADSDDGIAGSDGASAIAIVLALDCYSQRPNLMPLHAVQRPLWCDWKHDSSINHDLHSVYSFVCHCLCFLWYLIESVFGLFLFF